MQITVRYFDDCPNWQVADARLRDVLEAEGLDASVEYERVETVEAAEALEFRGSPTILVDGSDPFLADDAPLGLACRIYQTEAGPQGSPSESQLSDALRAAAR